MFRIVSVSFFRVAAALAAVLALSAAPCRAETIYLEPFYMDERDTVPCDIHEILGNDLSARGCIVWDKSVGMPPDMVVTGEFEKIGGVGWVTVRSFDSVIGRLVLGERVHIPSDPWLCRNSVKTIAEKILSPPFYERERRNYMDGVSGVEFVLVPGGTYKVGPERRTIINIPSFFVSRTEITQSQWERIMGVNPSTFTGNPDRPVESVSWFDVQEYIEKLRQVGRQKYRLPTEAEWEYAAQTRGRGQRWSGTGLQEEVDNYAWTRENAGMRTHPVAQKRGNGLGLHDFSGNVWEWCQDWYDQGYFSNPESRGNSIRGRVIRGGSWMMDSSYATTIYREKAAPESRSSDNGFRLVLTMDTDEAR